MKKPLLSDFVSKKQVLLFITWAFLVAISLLFLDKPIAKYCEWEMNASIKYFIGAFSDFGLGAPWAIFFSFLFICSYFIFKNQLWSIRIALFIGSLIGSSALSILKPIFGRSRPSLLFEENIDYFVWFIFQPNAKYWSFPSGHAATITGIGVVCIFLWPRWKSIFVILIVTVSLSRIVINTHYLSDVLGGMYLSFLLSSFLCFYFDKKRWLAPKELWQKY